VGEHRSQNHRRRLRVRRGFRLARYPSAAPVSLVDADRNTEQRRPCSPYSAHLWRARGARKPPPLEPERFPRRVGEGRPSPGREVVSDQVSSIPRPGAPPRPISGLQSLAPRSSRPAYDLAVADPTHRSEPSPMRSAASPHPSVEPGTNQPPPHCPCAPLRRGLRDRGGQALPTSCRPRNRAGREQEGPVPGARERVSASSRTAPPADAAPLCGSRPPDPGPAGRCRCESVLVVATVQAPSLSAPGIKDPGSTLRCTPPLHHCARTRWPAEPGLVRPSRRQTDTDAGLSSTHLPLCGVEQRVPRPLQIT